MTAETCAFYSGGKNSAAMVHRLDALGLTPDVVVFADTGLEFPETYDTIEAFEKKTGIEIIWEPAKQKFEDWFYRPYVKGEKIGQIHGFPMSHNKCYWNRETKGRVFQKYNRLYPVRYIGFAADEMHRNLVENEFNYTYPLQEWGWTEETSLSYCRIHDIANPLYAWGFPRLGCWLCPYQSKKSMRILYRYLERKSPESWAYLKKLEKDSPHRFKPDYDLSAFENCGLESFGIVGEDDS